MGVGGGVGFERGLKVVDAGAACGDIDADDGQAGGEGDGAGGLEAGGGEVHVEGLAAVADGELALDGGGVGRAEDDAEREGFAFTLARRRVDALEEDLVVAVVLEGHDVDGDVSGGGLGGGGVDVAAGGAASDIRTRRCMASPAIVDKARRMPAATSVSSRRPDSAIAPSRGRRWRRAWSRRRRRGRSG